MRFLKENILVAVIAGFLLTFTFSSCERNVCDNVTCDHGGSCKGGLCNCPTGYEGTRCQTLVSTRYLGVYTGYTTCDNLAGIFDTVTITQSTKGLLNVDVDVKSLRPKILHGTVESNVSVYRILIGNGDTTFTHKIDSATQKDTIIGHYFRDFTITLQSDKTLNVNIYEEMENPTDTVISKCNFLSQHKL